MTSSGIHAGGTGATPEGRGQRRRDGGNAGATGATPEGRGQRRRDGRPNDTGGA